MRLKSVVINDLYSFGPGVLVPFSYREDYEKTLITGRNNDEPGADSNGAGKSNILNVIFWILLGEVFQKENADDIIRRGKKSGSGLLTLIDDDKELVIERGRGSGKKKFLKVTFGGVSRTGDTDTATQTELLKILNISPTLKPAEIINDFVNTCYFSSDTVKGFMSKEVKSKQRFELIERYLGLKRYSYASEAAKTKKKAILDTIQPTLDMIADKEEFIKLNPKFEMEAAVESLTSARTGLADQIAVSQKTIEDARDHTELAAAIPGKETFIEQRKQAITQQLTFLETEFNTNKTLIDEKKQKKGEYGVLLLTVGVKETLAEKATTEQQRIQAESIAVNKAVMGFNTFVGTLNAEIDGIRGQITSHYSCPKCQTDLMVQEKILVPVDVKQLTRQLAEKEQERATIFEEIRKQQAIIGDLKTDLEATVVKIQDYTTDKKLLDTLIKPEVQTEAVTGLTARNAEITQQYETLGAAAQTEVGNHTIELTALKEKLASLPAGDTQAAQTNITALEQQSRSILIEVGQFTERVQNINAAEKQLTGLHAKIADKKKEADKYGFWELGFKHIKMNIIDEFLPDFEDKVNDYLGRLKVNMKVDFDTQKRKTKVSKREIAEGREFKEEFNVTVFKGENLLPFGLLSKGQRSRVGSCVGMALRELTKERGNNLFDFFFMDEIADSLDESGLRELVHLLDEVPGQKLVISHNDTLKNFIEDIITVEMNDETSSISHDNQ